MFKKLSVICSLVLAVGLMTAPAFGAAHYCKDYLEGGNVGGWGTSSKTFEENVILMESDTIQVDIWLNEVAIGDKFLAGGVEITLSPSVTLVNVEPYDNGPGGLPGPWASDMTNVEIPSSGPGDALITVGNLSGATVDGAGDIILARITIHCDAFGFDPMTVDLPYAGTWFIGDPSGTTYDAEIIPNVFTFIQVRCCNDAADCNDGIYCNGVETCDTDMSGLCGGYAGMCYRAAPIDPDDGVPCTDDSCVEDGGGAGHIENVENNANCDDGVSCTMDVCDSTTDCSNTPVDAACNDDNICSTDTCDPTLDCQYAPSFLSCDDTIYCNGADDCGGDMACSIHAGDPCNDDNACTNDTCTEAPSCTNVCNAVNGTDPCCSDAACTEAEVCQAGAQINIGDAWCECEETGCKVDICLVNLEIPVGGLQIDLCDEGDCLECTECELTERSVVFDCVVNELDNGCCRLIMFAKHPGGLINPGECDIVTIVYTLKDENDCCDVCIEIDGTGIIVADEYGYDIGGIIGDTGEVCPYNCGDVEPDESAPDAGDCGDGDIDIFDILMEVAIALGTHDPSDCQMERADVPTGTPPYCGNEIAPGEFDCEPNGVVTVLDVMVLIDAALDRQDCCSYCEGGIIY